MHAKSQNPHGTMVALTMLIAGAVFLLMMAAGLVMRAAQGDLIEIGAELFYQLLSVHGAGMVGTAGLVGAGILWFFLGRHVDLSGAAYRVFLGLFLLGVVFILVAILVGGYGAAWTFLYPLPPSPAVSGSPGPRSCLYSDTPQSGLDF